MAIRRREDPLRVCAFPLDTRVTNPVEAVGDYEIGSKEVVVTVEFLINNKSDVKHNAVCKPLNFCSR
jgi:hypothetical protein